MTNKIVDKRYQVSNRYHTYLIVGRAGVGKDTIANKLEELNFTTLKSYTTRSKRSESDDSHIFVDDELANNIKDIVAYTELNGHKYFATKQQLISSDVYIVNPNGIEVLCKNVPEKYKFTIIYVYSDDEISRTLSASRFADISEGYEVWDNRRADEDIEFSNFEHMIENKDFENLPSNIISVIPVKNEYTQKSLHSIIDIILNDFFMKCAINCAYEGILSKDGGPFGSVIVKDNQVVGIGHNQVLANNDPTCHGEMQAIRDACKNLNTFDLSGCILYTSAAPCPMCMGAILWSNIEKVYYGCSIQDTNDIGFRDEIFYKFMNTNFDDTDFLKQINHTECLKLFDDYIKMTDERY